MMGTYLLNSQNWSDLFEPKKSYANSVSLGNYLTNGNTIYFSSYDSNYKYMQNPMTKYLHSGSLYQVCQKGYRPIYHLDKQLLYTFGPGHYNVEQRGSDYFIDGNRLGSNRYYTFELQAAGGGGGGNAYGDEGGGGGGGGFIVSVVDVSNISYIVVGSGGAGGDGNHGVDGGSGGSTYIYTKIGSNVTANGGGGGGAVSGNGGAGGGYSANSSYRYVGYRGADGGLRCSNGKGVSSKYVTMNPEGSKYFGSTSGGSTSGNAGGGGGGSTLGNGGNGNKAQDGSGGGIGAGGGGADQGSWAAAKMGGIGGDGQCKIYY